MSLASLQSLSCNEPTRLDSAEAVELLLLFGLCHEIVDGPGLLDEAPARVARARGIDRELEGLEGRTALACHAPDLRRADDQLAATTFEIVVGLCECLAEIPSCALSDTFCFFLVFCGFDDA